VPSPLRIAHRGASGYAPENTLAAFQKALDLGSDLIEVDVRAASDGGLFLLHDSRVDRTTDGSGLLRDLTSEHARGLDAGAWFSAEFSGERLLPLGDALAFARDRCPLLVEVKDIGLEPSLLNLLRRTDSLNQVVLQSFDFPTVKRLKELESRISCGLLFGQNSPPGAASLTGAEVAEIVLGHGGNFAALAAPLLTPGLVADLHRRGMTVWAWTLDDPAHIQKAADMRVDGIISNFPDRVRQSV
jgi:glycerophosphoryl diester phosphodiesterase